MEVPAQGIMQAHMAAQESGDTESLQVHSASSGEQIATLHLPRPGAVSNVIWHPSCQFLIVEHIDKRQHSVSLLTFAVANAG